MLMNYSYLNSNKKQVYKKIEKKKETSKPNINTRVLIN